MGIKRAKPTTEKVSFYLSTKKAHGHEGQPAESVLWQGSYDDDVWPAAFTAGRKIIKHLVLKRGFQPINKWLRACLNGLGPNAPGENIGASLTLRDLKILVLVLLLLLKQYTNLKDYIFKKHFI